MVNTLAEGDIPTPWMPYNRFKIAEDGNGKKSTDAGKVGHTGVIGHKNAPIVKKGLHSPKSSIEILSSIARSNPRDSKDIHFNATFLKRMIDFDEVIVMPF